MRPSIGKKVTLAGLMGAVALSGAINSKSALAQEAQEEARHGYYLPYAANELSASDHNYSNLKSSFSLGRDTPPQLGTTALKEAGTYTYYLPASANAGGAFGSQWRTLLQGRNQGDITAFIYMKAHPRGQPAGDLDPVAQPLAIGPRVSFDYHNILGERFGYTGAAWIEIESDQPLSFEQSNTYNLAPDGSRQGTAYPIFDRDTIHADQRIMHRGDTIEYRLLGEENGKRENWIIFNPPGSQELIARLKLLDSNGMTKAENWHIIPAKTYWQASPLGLALTGDPNVVNPGDSLQITIDRSTPGEGDVMAYSIISQIDTVNQEKQDPITLEGKIYRLVEEAEYTRTPQTVEVNDPQAKKIHLKARNGVTIVDIYEDVNSDGINDNIWHPNANSFTYEFTGSSVQANSDVIPRLRVTFQAELGTFIEREIIGAPYTVNPEQNGYIASYNDARAFIMGNLDLASTWASHGLAGGWATKPSDWISGWPLYFNGVNNPPNDPELDYLKFNDEGNALTGNIMQLYCRDGSVLGILGMPEAEFDQFRRVVKAVKP